MLGLEGVAFSLVGVIEDPVQVLVLVLGLTVVAVGIAVGEPDLDVI